MKGKTVKHLIDGVATDLRSLSDDELLGLIYVAQQRLARVDEELESLCGEVCRREPSNVIYLFGDPETPDAA